VLLLNNPIVINAHGHILRSWLGYTFPSYYIDIARQSLCSRHTSNSNNIMSRTNDDNDVINDTTPTEKLTEMAAAWSTPIAMAITVEPAKRLLHVAVSSFERPLSLQALVHVLAATYATPVRALYRGVVPLIVAAPGVTPAGLLASRIKYTLAPRLTERDPLLEHTSAAASDELDGDLNESTKAMLLEYQDDEYEHEDESDDARQHSLTEAARLEERLFWFSAKMALVSEILADTAVDAVLFPLTVAHTRLVSCEIGRYDGMFDCLGSMARTEGVSSWYRGVATMVLGGLVCAGMAYLSYDAVKYLASRTRRLLGIRRSAERHGVFRWLVAKVARLVGTLVALPIDSECTRQQLCDAPGFDTAGMPYLSDPIHWSEQVAQQQTYYASRLATPER